jgi:transposase
MNSEIEITPSQIKELSKIYRGNDSHRVRQRAHALILLHQESKTPDEVSVILSVSRVTIYNWISRWRSEGIEGLYDLEGRGRKPLFSKHEEKIILEEIKENPSSIRQAAAKIEKITGKKAHIETLRKILKKNGKIWKRKRKTPMKKPDPTDYEQGKKDIEELKLLASQGEFDIVYFDESRLSLQPVVPYAWQDRGQSGTLKIPSSHSKGINFLGFLNPVANSLEAWLIDGSVTSETVIKVMDE